MKKLTLLILTIVSMIAQTISAQSYFGDGYIITIEGDTVHGKIMDKFNNKVSQKIKFMDSDGKVKKYYANQIRGYVKRDTYFFVSVKIYDFIISDDSSDETINEDDYRFAKIQINGYVQLLSLREKSIKTGQLPFLDVSLFEYVKQNITPGYFLKRYDETDTKEINASNFIDIATEYFSDYTELNEMILTKVFTYKDTPGIVFKYNAWKLNNVMKD